jgi:hypothetical protein
MCHRAYDACRPNLCAPQLTARVLQLFRGVSIRWLHKEVTDYAIRSTHPTRDIAATASQRCPSEADCPAPIGGAKYRTYVNSFAAIAF